MMKHRLILTFCLALGLVSLAGPGCHHQNDGPPPPLPAEQIPAAFAAGFKDAKPEVKDLADKFLKTLEAKDGIEKKDMGREKLCVLMGPVGAERAFERHRMPSFPAFYFLLAFADPATYWTLSP